MRKIVFVALSLFSTLLFSKESFEIKNVRFTLNVDRNWESVLKNPHNLYLLKKSAADLGNEKPKSVLLVSNTTLAGVTFNERAMRAQVSTYREGRENYLKGKEATIDQFAPLEIVKNSSGLIFYIVGVDYQIGNDKYFERSMFLNCSNKIFHVKSLDFILTEDATSAFQLGKSFKCVD